MDRIQAALLRESVRDFRPCGAALLAKVVRSLADHHPEVRAVLPFDTTKLHGKWFATLEQVAEKAEKFHTLEAALGEAGRRAAGAGVRVEHYAILRDEVLTAMSDLAGDSWTMGMARAWTDLLDAASGAMLAGAFGGKKAA